MGLVMSDFALENVEVSLSPLERFEEFLQSRGKRMTQQRRVIVEQVFEGHEHFDADQLVDMLVGKTGEKKASRPTVYRTLAEMVDSGILRKMDLDGRAVYEHDYGYPQHDHLYCQKCQKLFEFHSDEIVKVRDAVARTHRFRVSSHRLIISGICTGCVRQRRTRPLDLV